MSLVEKALATPRASEKRDDDDTVKLAIAWVTGVVSDSQAAAVTKTTVPNVASKMSRILRRAVEAGRIRVEVLR